MILSEARFSCGKYVPVRKITLEQISPREYTVTDSELVEEIFGVKKWKTNYFCPFPNMEYARIAFTGLISRAASLGIGNPLDQDGLIEQQHKVVSKGLTQFSEGRY